MTGQTEGVAQEKRSEIHVGAFFLGLQYMDELRRAVGITRHHRLSLHFDVPFRIGYVRLDLRTPYDTAEKGAELDLYARQRLKGTKIRLLPRRLFRIVVTAVDTCREVVDGRHVVFGQKQVAEAFKIKSTKRRFAEQAIIQIEPVYKDVGIQSFPPDSATAALRPPRANEPKPAGKYRQHITHLSLINNTHSNGVASQFVQSRY